MSFILIKSRGKTKNRSKTGAKQVSYISSNKELSLALLFMQFLVSPSLCSPMKKPLTKFPCARFQSSQQNGHTPKGKQYMFIWSILNYNLHEPPIPCLSTLRPTSSQIKNPILLGFEIMGMGKKKKTSPMLMQYFLREGVW